MTRFGVRYFVEPAPSGHGKKIQRASFCHAVLEYIEATYNIDEIQDIYKSLARYKDIRCGLGDTIITDPFDIIHKLNCNKLSPENITNILAFALSFSDLDGILKSLVYRLDNKSLLNVDLQIIEATKQ